MILGRVVGELWATQRHPGLDGRKLLVIRPHLWYEPPFQCAHLVAVDTLGAGVGEDVVVCLGEPARQHLSDEPQPASTGVPGYASAARLPIEAAVMAIVDNVQLGDTSLPRPRPLRFIGPAPQWAGPPGSPGSETSPAEGQRRTGESE
jgi:ethanolamine utilization protein EutN